MFVMLFLLLTFNLNLCLSPYLACFWAHYTDLDLDWGATGPVGLETRQSSKTRQSSI
jgi:hypothetical protein